MNTNTRNLLLLFLLSSFTLLQAASLSPDSLYSLSREAMQQGDYRTAIRYCHDAEELLPEDSLRSLAHLQLTLSACHFRLGELSDALRFVEQSESINEQLQDSFQLSCALNNKAAILKAMGNMHEAEQVITRSIALTRATTDPLSCPLAIRLGMLGEVLQAEERYQEALDTTYLAYRLDSLSAREARLGARLSQLGICYECLDQYAQAEHCMRCAIPLLEKYNNHSSLAINYNALARLLGRQGRINEALAFGLKAVDLAKQYNMNQTLYTAYIVLSRFAPEWSDRYAYLQLASDIKDSIFSEELRAKTAEYAIQYRLAEEELESEQLQEEKYIMLSIILALATLLLIVATAWAFYTLRQHRINKRRIEEAAFRLAQGQVIETDEQKIPALTDREREVIKLCCKGLSSKQIADQLHLSSRTVEGHKTAIFHKLHINTTTELVIYAMQHGLT